MASRALPDPGLTLVLGGVLRSVLAPLYLGLTVVLSYVATMGATAFVTITLGGDLGIGNRVAVYVLVFLVALGVDYTIFLMTRYRQELRERHPVDALRVAVVRTGGVISSAGLILAAILAAVMSTLSCQLLVCSSALTEDFYRGFVRPAASERELVWVGRAMVALVALVAIFIARDPESRVLGLVSYAWAGFGAAFFGGHA